MALITAEHNQLLLKPIEMNELEGIVKKMVVDKAPGPDSFTTNFFQECWNMVKDEVLEIVEDSRRTHNILKAFNSTFLTLIPKETKADEPGKFRLIALCILIYKIITKIISNHLKPLLPMLIS